MATTVSEQVTTARPIDNLPNAALMASARVLVDLVALSVAILSAFRIWSLINPAIPPVHPSMCIAVGLSLGVLGFYGLYPGIGLTAVEWIRRMVWGITLVYLVLTASMFLVKDWRVNSRGALVLSWIGASVFGPVCH